MRRSIKRKLRGTLRIDYVRCRICGDHRQVISGRHLSKHEIDRWTYMTEYGLTADQLIAKAFRLNRSRRQQYRAYGKTEWCVAIKSIYRTTGDTFANNFQKTYPHMYQQGVWIYGDWNSALRAAGFDPDAVRRRHSWNKENVIVKIQALHKQSLPLYAKYVQKHYGPLFDASCRLFGSWPKALVAAGITSKLRARKLYRGRDSLLNVLSQAVHDKSVSKVPKRLRIEAEHYFGSFEKALTVLKRTEHSLPGWNRHKVIRVLSAMHKAGKDLRYQKVRQRNMAITSAAEKHFGSWGKALVAAGIEARSVSVRR
jgi:hypothetical protein